MKKTKKSSVARERLSESPRGGEAESAPVLEGEVLGPESDEAQTSPPDSVEIDATSVVEEAEPLAVEVEAVLEDEPSSEEEAEAPDIAAPIEGAVEARPSANRESRGIVRYDPVDAYLREIRAYPPLTREEEHELALRYRDHQDVDAAYKLVTSNLWLVVKIARDYERAARSLLDLVQEGNIGLMEAVKNFDPFRGVRFPSYAVWWIKAYIIRYLIANWRLVKIGTTQAQRKLFFNLRKEKDRLEREGFSPAPKLLAEKLNVKESEVIEMEQRLGGSDMSVDAPLPAGDSDTNLLSVLPAPQSSAEELLDRKQSQQLLMKGLEEFGKTLKEKERIIFEQRMLGEEKATLQDISEKIGVSRERVRQIENRLREKLKDFLKERLGAALENMEF